MLKTSTHLQALSTAHARRTRQQIHANFAFLPFLPMNTPFKNLDQPLINMTSIEDSSNILGLIVP